VRRKAPITIKVPAGIEDGGVMRVAAGGDAGIRGGSPGDLYIQINIRPHAHFIREKRDLIYECPIPVWKAVLGGEADVPLIEGGRTTIRIPSGTQFGKMFRVKGKGMPGTGGRPRGDLLVKIRVEIPVDLTPRQKELYTQLAAAENDGGTVQEDIQSMASAASNAAKKEGLFDELKDILKGKKKK